MPKSLLIVDDEASTREGLQSALGEKFDVYLAANADEAFSLMDQIEFEVILTDLRMAGKSGLKVIDKSLKLKQKPVVIMMTAYGNIETAVDAMRRGATDFLQKPVNLEKLELTIEKALKMRSLEQENETLHQRLDEKFSFESFIGNSQPIKHLIEQIKLVAPSKATVLLEGDTGTGKELAAQAIHQNSDRARQNFVAVHCAALPANLLESELFGHEKGAFTGAGERRIGRFERADGGTLFLDEIGEIDASIQVKLLRFLETKSFERVGSNEPINVNVRLVTATNKDLQKLVREGKFREDLYYRLNVVKITLPPLKDRKEDIPLLIEFFLKKFAQENGFTVPSITSDTKEILYNYYWSGNVRELRNFCERMVVLRRGQIIGKTDLEPKFFAPEHKVDSAANSAVSLDEREKQAYAAAIAQAKGNKSKAAELMGISRRTLHRKLKEWGE